MIFQGIQYCEETLHFCYFSGGGGVSGPPVPPLDPHMMFPDMFQFNLARGSREFNLASGSGGDV